MEYSYFWFGLTIGVGVTLVVVGAAYLWWLSWQERDRAYGFDTDADDGEKRQ